MDFGFSYMFGEGRFGVCHGLEAWTADARVEDLHVFFDDFVGFLQGHVVFGDAFIDCFSQRLSSSRLRR